jgi:hypothetical protein
VLYCVGTPACLCSTYSYPLKSYWRLLHSSYPICQAVCLSEMVSLPQSALWRTVLCLLWNRGKDELANLSHSQCFVTEVEMNENDWVCRPGLQIWRTAGTCWVWNDFNLLRGSQPMICLFFICFHKWKRNAESKSFQNVCGWKEPVLEALRLPFSWNSGVLFWRSGRTWGKNMRTCTDILTSENSSDFLHHRWAHRCCGMNSQDEIASPSTRRIFLDLLHVT